MIGVGKITSCKDDRSRGPSTVVDLARHDLEITKNSFKISSFYLDLLTNYVFHRQAQI